ncbi:MAG: SRPBCC family protein [Acidibrevibacterium sp.]|uniref:SRPBCC family protein n=1 Tax=Acidibrevibacterium fodinaquatile TaxID=1969806 RepID=UPI0023A8208D|nr:SRPBCC family protein [Acidibrevibacterium fodinaquatile]MCA7119223.1 SRPBCC family protein [Acidibrevibacterium fodinaquatile]
MTSKTTIVGATDEGQRSGIVMTKVYVSAVIPAPAAEVWRVVRNFNALPDWTPFVAESRIEHNAPPDQIGCIRNFRLRDGGVIREQFQRAPRLDAVRRRKPHRAQRPA